MIQSSGNNLFKDNRFDFRTWSAPILQTPEEVSAKLRELDLTGRTVRDIQAVGRNYMLAYDCFYEVFEAVRRNDDAALASLEFPCMIEIDEPLLIRFEDGDILGIDFSEGSSVRMEMNTLPWDILPDINARNCHADRMFRKIQGTQIADVFMTTSLKQPIFTGKHGLELAEQSSYVRSISFECRDNSPGKVPRSEKLTFEPDLDYGNVFLENDYSGIVTLPGTFIRDIMEGYPQPD